MRERIVILVGLLVLLSVGFIYQSRHAATLTEGTAAVGSFATSLPETMEGERYQLAVGTTSFAVTVAADRRSRIQGLSGVRSLAEGEGKLFVFEQADTYGFWMPNMYISLDMLWFSEDGTLIHIEEGVSPETYPELFLPDEPARYVLEVASSSVAQYGITKGMELVLSPELKTCLSEGCY